MSELYAYICTRSTSDPYLPTRTTSLEVLARDVSDAFQALSGGRFLVGQLAFFPVQRSVPNYLLCDGREVPQVAFPELYAYLGDTQGAPADPDNFVLPFYVGAAASLDPAPATDTETTTAGTVSTPAPTTPPPAYDPDTTEHVYGDVDSGGRYYRNLDI